MSFGNEMNFLRKLNLYSKYFLLVAPWRPHRSGSIRSIEGVAICTPHHPPADCFFLGLLFPLFLSYLLFVPVPLLAGYLREARLSLIDKHLFAQCNNMQNWRTLQIRHDIMRDACACKEYAAWTKEINSSDAILVPENVSRFVSIKYHSLSWFVSLQDP